MKDKTYFQLGFVEILTLIFIVLKLTNIVDWSWWWVLCPLWIGFAIFVSIICIIILAAIIQTILKSIE